MALISDQRGSFMRSSGEKASFRLVSGFLPQRRAPAHKCKNSRGLRGKCLESEAELRSEGTPNERNNSPVPSYRSHSAGQMECSDFTSGPVEATAGKCAVVLPEIRR